jgi:predicted DNA-binding protein (UPF0251 family)
MPRPRHCRRVVRLPQANYYKPRGVPLSVLEEITLTVDEFEAIRLTDLEGLYQADAAEKMNISRQTLGRILESAHKKIADALVHGKALLIKGGPIQIITPRVEGVPPSNRGQDARDTAGPKRGRGRCRRRGGGGPR